MYGSAVERHRLSQAYQPQLIGAARWGGVYAVGFLVVLVNTAIAFVILQRLRRSFLIAISILLFTALVIFLTNLNRQVRSGELRSRSRQCNQTFP